MISSLLGFGEGDFGGFTIPTGPVTFAKTRDYSTAHKYWKD